MVIAITLALKGKSNTGVPNNNKDDEKVNPLIDPENLSTNPESDDKKPEQNSQEQNSSVRLKVLKVAGATAAGGTLARGGAYLVNKLVLKRGKSSKEGPKNVNGKYLYLDSNGNEVTKNKQDDGTQNSDGTENKDVGVSDVKQNFEDKDAEKIEKRQNRDFR